MKKGLCIISFMAIMLIVACMLSACNMNATHASSPSVTDPVELFSDGTLSTKLLTAKEEVSNSASAESEASMTNEEKSALVDSFIQNAQSNHVVQENYVYELLGEVGDYTLVRLDIGGDCAVVINVYDGYHIFSPTIGYPSETNLYLIGDSAMFTLNAAYEQGLISDMGEVYHLLPETYRAGYDPSVANSYATVCNENALGFQNGTFSLK